jgi:hypothetical protein
MRSIALVLIVLHVWVPFGIPVAHAETLRAEEGLFGFRVQDGTIVLLQRTVLAVHTLTSGSEAEIRAYLGKLSEDARSRAILSVAECCAHIRETLSAGDVGTLLSHVTPQAAEALLPEADMETYIRSLSVEEKNALFTELDSVQKRRIVTTIPHALLHDTLLALSDTNQTEVLESMSQEEIDTFVEEENNSGMGGMLLVGLGAAAALYLLSTASVPMAAAATEGIQTASGVNLVPFGGRSLGVVPCTCTPGFFLVAVGPPRPGLFMYGPGTALFLWGNIAPPAWQLGKASVPLVCLVYTGDKCVPAGKGLYVIMAGTSLK